MKQAIYLDNSMTARPSAQAISRMLPFYTDYWGSPSSPHQFGQMLCPYIEESYKKIYDLLGAKSEDNFVFTSSGTESINQAVQSAYYDITLTTGKNHYLVPHIEEAPALLAISRLELFGCKGKMIHPDKNGVVTAKSVADTISPRTAMLSLSWANGLTGVINPVSEIALLCQERGIRFHLDATHILGKLFYDPDDFKADMISFNGEQIHAPKGTGGLYIKNGVKCSPFILGGIEQGGYRAGPFNIPGLVGLGYAAQEAKENRDLLCTEVARLRNRLEEGILQEIPEAIVHFRDQDRVPNCTAISFPGIANEALLYALNRKGVYASIGGGSFQQIGFVLEGCGVAPEIARSAISFSLSRDTCDEDIEDAVVRIAECVHKLKKVSNKLVKL